MGFRKVESTVQFAKGATEKMTLKYTIQGVVMLNIFDVVPEPVFTEAPEIGEAAKSTPWILGYVAIGALILIAVLVVIKLIVKSSGKKTK